MIRNKIIIAGFGRSGTTWLSDIISKSMGGLILFEPFHPLVFKSANEYCYHNKIAQSEVIKTHLEACFSQSPDNSWLLRNHLPNNNQNKSQSYIDYIWNNSKVLGLKTLRLNHALNELSKLMSAQVVYIYRHPLAVLISINNRINFWKEFSWEWHKKVFIERSLKDQTFNAEERKLLANLFNGIKHKNEMILFMWAVSFIISLSQVKLAKGHIVNYEDLYLDPYLETKKILQFLEVQENSNLHPSYFFTPSMTSLSTLHNRLEFSNLTKNTLEDFFWKSKVSKSSEKNMKSLVANILSINPAAHKLAKESLFIN